MQLKYLNIKISLYCILIFVLSSCSTDNTKISVIPEEEIESEVPTSVEGNEETPTESSTTTIGELGTVTFYNEELS